MIFKYSKDNINYYYNLSGPEIYIYSGALPNFTNTSTNILSNITLGINKELAIGGTFGDNNLTNNGISVTPVNIYGKTNSISIDNQTGTVHNKININTIIDSSTEGIVIGPNI